MTTELAKKQCVPRQVGVRSLTGKDLEKLQKQLECSWQVVNEHHLEKEFTFRNFRQALAFTNQVGELSESQGHHPDIYLTWGKVKLTIWTHTIDGLTESDFILAAKIDELQ